MTEQGDVVATGEDNPFLIPPPPGRPTPPLPEVPEPSQPETDTAGFITLPPGIADSATNRIPMPRPQRVERPLSDEVVFFPTAPGAPPPPGESVALPDAEETRVGVPRHSAPAWRISLVATGERITIDKPLYLGRNPVAGLPDSALLSIADPTKSVSKTHAMLEVDGEMLWVHDLDSTNGVFVTAPGSETVPVTPGERMRVPEGSELELGEYPVVVERA